MTKCVGTLEYTQVYPLIQGLSSEKDSMGSEPMALCNRRMRSLAEEYINIVRKKYKEWTRGLDISKEWEEGESMQVSYCEMKIEWTYTWVKGRA